MGFEKKQCESNSDQQSIWNLTRVILSVRLCCIIIVVTVIVVVCVVVVVVVVELNDMEHIKSGSKPSVFDTFDFQMCFAPQRRALFRHRLAIESSKSGPNPTLQTKVTKNSIVCNVENANTKQKKGPVIFYSFNEHVRDKSEYFWEKKL